VESSAPVLPLLAPTSDSPCRPLSPSPPVTMVAGDGWEGGLEPSSCSFLLFFFSSLANNREAAGSRFGSISPCSLSGGHGYGVEVGRSIGVRSHADTPWPSPWRGFALSAIAPTPLIPFLFYNKSVKDVSAIKVSCELKDKALHILKH
jgi:hypothetical protein